MGFSISVWYWAITVLLLPIWFKNSALLARLWPKIWNVAHKSDHLTASSLALWPPYDLWGRSLKLHDLILKLNPYQPLFLHYFSKFYTFLWPWLFFWKIHVCRNLREVLKAACTVLCYWPAECIKKWHKYLLQLLRRVN